MSVATRGSGGERHRLPVGAAFVAALALVCLPAAAQTAGKLFVRPQADAYFPLDTYSDSLTGDSKQLYSTLGFGAGAAIDFAATSWLVPFARGMYIDAPYAGGGQLQGAEGDLGLGLVIRPLDRMTLRLDVMGGLAELFPSDRSAGAAYAAGGRLGLEYRLASAWKLSASGGYQAYLGSDMQSILSAVQAGIYLSYDLSALGGEKSRLTVEEPKLDAVFPSLYAYYDDNPFGTVKVVNREDAAIRDVTVSFNAGHYMDQPKVCGEYARLAKGESVIVPVKALFTDSVLQITQGTDAKGEIIVKYSYLGAERAIHAPIDFRMHHRNAITWSDDRRAASFVSPTNPAALWFSKYASGVVRDRLRGDVNKPLQYAIGMFEAERLYGLNYVVVPANDYSVKHGLKDYIDSVQFPHQTLSNRGGDCSDLAILFATLMQTVGVNAAFITIPGHIFAAFDTGLDEAEAKTAFYDPNLLVYRGGRAWIPVEITMVKDGFIKAWRVAAKEWADNLRAGTAAFYTLPDCWKVYPPAAFPGVNPRFTLPPDTDTAVAFDGALDRFVAREIEPQVQAFQGDVAGVNPVERANDLGILYARYGMLKESWKQFSESAKSGCQPAWTNLASVAFLRKDYKLALSYYQYAYGIDASDDNALLGKARCEYELEDFDSSDRDYATLKARNPGLAGKFGYLASIFGGEGRAWSLADRAVSTTWASTRKASPSSVAAKAATPPLVDDQAAKAELARKEAVAKAEADALAKAQVDALAKAQAEALAKAEADAKAKADALAASQAAALAKAEAEAKAMAEANAQADAKAKADAEAQAKALAKAQADAKALTDAKAKAEAQAKADAMAKAQAEALAKAEAEKKSQAEALAKAQAEAKAQADALVKAQADALAKAQAEALAKAQAEALAKAQAEALAKVQAEALSKAQVEEKAQADALAKAKADAELTARTAVLRPPVIATELPKDVELAQKSAELAEQKKAAAVEEPKQAVAKPVAPLAVPTIAAELPKDVELSQKAAEAKAQAEAQLKTDALAGNEAAVKAKVAVSAPPVIATELPKDLELAQKNAELAEQKKVAAAEAPKRAAINPVAPFPVPQVAAELPKDVELSREATVAAGQKKAEEAAPTAISTPTASIKLADPPQNAGPVMEAPKVEPVAEAPKVEPVAEAPKVEPVAVEPNAEAVELTSIAAAVPPVGASDLPLTIDKEILLEGFENAIPLVGKWRVDSGNAKQIDGEAFYAKLAMPLVQNKETYTYSFTAKSDARGRGWVGLGIHLFTPKSYTLKGYGSGDSICVWLTRDPVHFTENTTRLQIYRSVNDWDMKLLDEIPVTESIYDNNRFEVTVDPVAGEVSVQLNGNEKLAVKGILDLHKGLYVLFRALDKASFSDFQTEVAK